MFQVLVLLYAGESGLEGLRAFEQKAIQLIREHEGVLISAFNPHQPDGPDEIHLLQFPSESHLQAYLADPRTAALTPERNKALRQTIVYTSAQFQNYPPK